MKGYNDLINKIYNGVSINFQNCENASLALTKLIKKEIIENTKLKRNFLQSFSNVNFSNSKVYYPYRISLKRIEEQVSFLVKNQKYELVYSNRISTQSRLIIGLGSQHVLETSITLHHILGVPYIPGSALKGVCRAVAFWKLAESKGIQIQEEFYKELVKDDEEILKYQLLFGAQNFKGLLLFLDAYPTENNSQIFDLDIMNVHYPSYYEGKSAPGDWENPRPIFFLVVKEGVEFQFNVLFDDFRWEKIKDNFSEKVKNCVEDLIRNQKFFGEILKEALCEFGVGSKTRLGYGLFKEEVKK
ncbi:MAG: type III-B CRISPR module RAMP protein Cmr6 [candidate division WOR-3 bacterium]